MGEFNRKDLADSACAFSTAGELAPGLFNSISVMVVKEAKGFKLQLMGYVMSMQDLAEMGQIKAGFALLKRVGVKQLLSNSDDEGYPMFHNLLQACCFVGDFSSVSQVQAAIDRLGLIARAPDQLRSCKARCGSTKTEMLVKALLMPSSSGWKCTNRSPTSHSCRLCRGDFCRTARVKSRKNH